MIGSPYMEAYEVQLVGRALEESGQGRVVGNGSQDPPRGVHHQTLLSTFLEQWTLTDSIKCSIGRHLEFHGLDESHTGPAARAIRMDKRPLGAGVQRQGLVALRTLPADQMGQALDGEKAHEAGTHFPKSI